MPIQLVCLLTCVTKLCYVYSRALRNYSAKERTSFGDKYCIRAHVWTFTCETSFLRKFVRRSIYSHKVQKCARTFCPRRNAISSSLNRLLISTHLFLAKVSARSNSTHRSSSKSNCRFDFIVSLIFVNAISRVSKCVNLSILGLPFEMFANLRRNFDGLQVQFASASAMHRFRFGSLCSLLARARANFDSVVEHAILASWLHFASAFAACTVCNCCYVLHLLEHSCIALMLFNKFLFTEYFVTCKKSSNYCFSRKLCFVEITPTLVLLRSYLNHYWIRMFILLNELERRVLKSGKIWLSCKMVHSKCSSRTGENTEKIKSQQWIFLLSPLHHVLRKIFPFLIYEAALKRILFAVVCIH